MSLAKNAPVWRWWHKPGDLFLDARANTKSEARAIFKRKLKGVLPLHIVIQKVKDGRA